MAMITAEEVVIETMKILEDIRVPVKLFDEIGVPISNALNNMEACCAAWRRERIAENSKENGEPEPDDNNAETDEEVPEEEAPEEEQ